MQSWHSQSPWLVLKWLACHTVPAKIIGLNGLIRCPRLFGMNAQKVDMQIIHLTLSQEYFWIGSVCLRSNSCNIIQVCLACTYKNASVGLWWPQGCTWWRIWLCVGIYVLSNSGRGRNEGGQWIIKLNIEFYTKKKWMMSQCSFQYNCSEQCSLW